MKRIGALALATALVGSLTGAALADETPLIASNPNAYATAITVNGTALDTAALPAVEGIPMRLVVEADHGSASWFQEENSSSFYFSEQRIEVSFADGSVKVNDEPVEGVTAQVVGGVTFLPVSVLEGLEGITVEEGEDSLTITTPNNDPLVQLTYAVADAAGIAYGMKADQEALSNTTSRAVAGVTPLRIINSASWSIRLALTVMLGITSASWVSGEITLMP